MADYWKSQDRKYCDFCKCWLTDNKASVEFHEKGRKHKENVAKRLKFITKKSLRDQKQTQRIDETIEQMEKAALAAYQKDLANNLGGDLTSKNIQGTLTKHNFSSIFTSASTSKSTKPTTPWYETKTLDGRIYYWNTETNKSIWDEPPEGFISMKDQKILAEKEGRSQLKAIEQHHLLQAKIQQQEEEQLKEEQRAAAEREKLKLLRPKEEEPKEASNDSPYFGPTLPPETSGPYGKWQKVETKVKEMDLQLPKQEFVAIHVPQATEVISREFKEKTVTKIDDGEEGEKSNCINFKKRKVMAGEKRRNMRQRLDED